MNLVVVTSPDPVVTADEAQAQVAALAEAADAVVESLLAASTGWLDGPNGYLGRALGLQTWDLKLDPQPFYVPTTDYVQWRCGLVATWWQGGVIELPLPPLVSVDEITYLDGDAVEQTWDEENYRVSGVGGKGRITLASGAAWPTLGAYPEALTIRFTAGYEEVPEPIKQAIVLGALARQAIISAASSSAVTGGTGIKRTSVLHGLIDVTYMSPGESASSSGTNNAAIDAAISSLVQGYKVY
jgi:hypothetical protein